MNRLKFSAIKPYLLPMLVVTSGMQMLRMLFPLVVWYQPKSVGWMIVVLLASFWTPILLAFVKSRIAMGLTVGGLALLRLAEVLSRDASFDLWISLLGSACFTLFLPLFLGYCQEIEKNRPPIRWGLGLLLGLALDTTLRILLESRDLGTIGGVLPIILQAMLTALIILLLAGEKIPTKLISGDFSRSSSPFLLFLGPFLLLQMVLLQNPAWFSERLALELPRANMLIGFANLLAILGFSLSLLRPRAVAILTPILVIVPLPLVLNLEMGRWALLFLLPLAQFAIGWSLAQLLFALKAESNPYLLRISAATGLSMILLVIFLFLTYGALVLNIPFPQESALPILWGILGLLTLTATLRARRFSYPGFKQFAPILIPITFLTMTFLHGLFLLNKSPTPSLASLPLKFMTYNIRSAISAFGQPDAETIARLIESSGADLVALQEVSRGWPMSGSTDLVTWLSRRLDMYAVFKGTADPLWGNAILSRYPFIESGHEDLPQLSSLIPRGYLWVKLDVGTSHPLFVIATHLHHVYPGEGVRIAQIEAILNEWNGAPYTIFLGDLNAAPGTIEIQRIEEAGFIDAWSASGEGTEFTFPSLAPDVRVDWIWYTPDLIAIETKVIQSMASDHLPVIAEIGAAK